MLAELLHEFSESFEIEVLRNDGRVGICRGDVCLAVPHADNPERLFIEWRYRDSYAPVCDVFRDEVKILPPRLVGRE